MNALTVTLNNGRIVLAKLYQGQPTALTYSNRTQAERVAALQGADWAVYHGTSRPFYVGKVPRLNVPLET